MAENGDRQEVWNAEDKCPLAFASYSLAQPFLARFRFLGGWPWIETNETAVRAPPPPRGLR